MRLMMLWPFALRALNDAFSSHRDASPEGPPPLGDFVVIALPPKGSPYLLSSSRSVLYDVSRTPGHASEQDACRWLSANPPSALGLSLGTKLIVAPREAAVLDVLAAR
jgi:hypothetical protein